MATRAGSRGGRSSVVATRAGGRSSVVGTRAGGRGCTADPRRRPSWRPEIPFGSRSSRLGDLSRSRRRLGDRLDLNRSRRRLGDLSRSRRRLGDLSRSRRRHGLAASGRRPGHGRGSRSRRARRRAEASRCGSRSRSRRTSSRSRRARRRSGGRYCTANRGSRSRRASRCGSRSRRARRRSGGRGCTADHGGESEGQTSRVEGHGESVQIEAARGGNCEDLCKRCFIDRVSNLRAGVEGARPAWQRTRSGPLRTGPHFEADSTGAHLQKFDLLRRLRPPHQKPCLIPRGPPPPPPHPKAPELGGCRPPTAR